MFIFIILILIILHLDISLCEISGEVGDISGDTDNASIQRQTRIGIVILSISLLTLILLYFYISRGNSSDGSTSLELPKATSGVGIHPLPINRGV